MSLAAIETVPTRWGPVATRGTFSAALGRAVAERAGFAAGKLGGSEQAFLQHAIVHGGPATPRQRRAFDVALAVRARRHAGVFPGDPAALATFAGHFAADVRGLDAIGIFPDAAEPTLAALAHHGARGTPMHFADQEPERSTPPTGGCWLEHLRDRRLLLVCPFASLLRERAVATTFEAVWAKSGKRWFAPATVEAIEQPYGFAPETQRRYGTALALLDELRQRMDAVAYDVALIAGGGLGIPLAVHAKRSGRVGVSLGGHLQVVFGVLGDRWRHDPGWRRDVHTPAWTDVPAHLRPDPAHTGENYW